MITGYVHPEYAHSLEEFGEPRQLSHCGGWILERQIPGFSLKDGMGCYPLFCCRNWSKIHLDLDDLKNDLLSLTLVTDPFGDYDLAYLQSHFDLVRPFKNHFVADLSLPIENIVSKHHRKCVRRSMKRVIVERCESPIQFLDDWIRLYDCLKFKHNINGIRTFSIRSFRKQLTVPGTLLFNVLYQRRIVGANIIYIKDDIAYGHLSAFDQQGYKSYAPYAVKWGVLNYLFNKVRWFNLGAGTGTQVNNIDGLSKFKKGWATGTRMVYLCGRIFDKERYCDIVKINKISDTDYFPAYRKEEFL